MCQGLLIQEVCRSHSATYHSWQDSTGRMMSSSQRTLTTNNTHKRYPCPRGVGIHNLSRPAAADTCLKPRRALTTLVAQPFSCPNEEHCFIRERAHWQNFCCCNRKVAACCGLADSRGNRNVGGNDRTHMFVCPRALATGQMLASCSKMHKPCVFRHTAMSVVEDAEKLI